VTTSTPKKKSAKPNNNSHQSTPQHTVGEDIAALEQQWQESRAKNLIQPHQLAPGIHLNISFEDYCRIPALNFSSLRTAKQSLAHYRYGTPMEDAPYFRFGSLIHCGKLEPEQFLSRYVVLPDKQFVEQVVADRAKEISERLEAMKSNDKLKPVEPYSNVKATSAYKRKVEEFMLAHPGKQEVSSDWFEKTQGILRALRSNQTASDLFREGLPEVTLIGQCPQTGELCKARTDWLSISRQAPCDLKTTNDIFGWSVDKFDYHIQAAWYLFVYDLAYNATTPKQRKKLHPHLPKPDRESFWFIVLETERPWTTLAAPIDGLALEVGNAEGHYLLQKIADAKRTGAYPKLDHIASWSLGKWFKPFEFPLAQSESVIDLGMSRLTDSLKPLKPPTPQRSTRLGG
jgi:hypothetical protein